MFCMGRGRAYDWHWGGKKKVNGSIERSDRQVPASGSEGQFPEGRMGGVPWLRIGGRGIKCRFNTARPPFRAADARNAARKTQSQSQCQSQCQSDGQCQRPCQKLVRVIVRCGAVRASERGNLYSVVETSRMESQRRRPLKQVKVVKWKGWGPWQSKLMAGRGRGSVVVQSPRA